jgi:hypothetical protein
MNHEPWCNSPIHTSGPCQRSAPPLPRMKIVITEDHEADGGRAMKHHPDCADNAHIQGSPCRDLMGNRVMFGSVYEDVKLQPNASHVTRIMPFSLIFPEKLVRPSPLVDATEARATPMVYMRPLSLGITTHSNARLLATLYIGGQFFDLGCIDLWPREKDQKRSAFKIGLGNMATIGPAITCRIVVTNLSRKYVRRFTAQIDGVIGEVP